MSASRSADPLAVTEREMLIDLRGKVESYHAEMTAALASYAQLSAEQLGTLRRDQDSLHADVDRLGDRFRVVEAKDTVTTRQLWSVGSALVVVGGAILAILDKLGALTN